MYPFQKSRNDFRTLPNLRRVPARIDRRDYVKVRPKLLTNPDGREIAPIAAQVERSPSAETEPRGHLAVVGS